MVFPSKEEISKLTLEQKVELLCEAYYGQQKILTEMEQTRSEFSLAVSSILDIKTTINELKNRPMMNGGGQTLIKRVDELHNILLDKDHGIYFKDKANTKFRNFWVEFWIAFGKVAGTAILITLIGFGAYKAGLTEKPVKDTIYIKQPIINQAPVYMNADSLRTVLKDYDNGKVK